MATDPRLGDVTGVVEFLHRHAEAEHALAVASLTQPDDDAYLLAQEHARSFYAAGVAVGPRDGRTARPGGRSEVAGGDVRGSLAEVVVYAVARAPGGWVGLLSSRRDPRRFFVAEALLIRETGEGRRIVARAEWDSLDDGLHFVQAGGDSFDVHAVRDAVVLTEPAADDHAEFVRRWGS